MAITLDEPKAPGLPVVKRTTIGQRFAGALVEQHQRDVLKKGERVLKPDGKPRQELVLTLVVMPGTTTPATISGEGGVPAPGELVRVILRGAGFGEWIEARKHHGELQVGDVVEQSVEYAQVYDADGNAVGGKITDQATADRVPRGQSLGFYGPTTLRRATATEASWVTAAEAAYHERKQRIAVDPTPYGDEEPF